VVLEEEWSRIKLVKRTLLGSGPTRTEKPRRGITVHTRVIRPQLWSQFPEQLLCISLDIFRAVDFTPNDGSVRLFDMVYTIEKIKGLDSLFDTLIDRQSAFEVESKLCFDNLDARFARHYWHVVDEWKVGRVAVKPAWKDKSTEQHYRRVARCKSDTVEERCRGRVVWGRNGMEEELESGRGVGKRS
jgi:hypothetical protein